METLMIGIGVTVVSAVLLSMGANAISNTTRTIGIERAILAIEKQNQIAQARQDESLDAIGQVKALVHSIEIEQARISERHDILMQENAANRQLFQGQQSVYALVMSTIEQQGGRIESMQERIAELPRRSSKDLSG